MLAELCHPGSALAARVVVTPLGGQPTCMGPAATVSRLRANASPSAPDAACSQETDRSNVAPEFDWPSGLLMAARQAVAQARAISRPRPSVTESSVRVIGTEPVRLTIIGEIDWRQSAQSANDVQGAAKVDSPSNISDDILKMLSDGSFSATRITR
jgi:hypothetical protein